MNSISIAADPDRRTGPTRPAPILRRPVHSALGHQAPPIDITVLLVDDDTQTRRTMAYILKQCTGLQPRLRVRCLEVSSGAEGLALAMNPEVQFVFLDYHMPDMTGVDFLSSILKQRPTMPVALLTGNEHTGLAVEAMKRGAYDVLLKVDATQDLLNRTLRQGLAWATLQERLYAQSAQLTQMELCVNLT